MATIEEQLAALKAENETLKAKAHAAANRPITLKVSEKGAVSVYGLGRFPVTLYSQQMTRLLDHADAIRAFMADPANVRRLAVKE